MCLSFSTQRPRRHTLYNIRPRLRSVGKQHGRGKEQKANNGVSLFHCILKFNGFIGNIPNQPRQRCVYFALFTLQMYKPPLYWPTLWTIFYIGSAFFDNQEANCAKTPPNVRKTDRRDPSPLPLPQGGGKASFRCSVKPPKELNRRNFFLHFFIILPVWQSVTTSVSASCDNAEIRV